MKINELMQTFLMNNARLIAGEHGTDNTFEWCFPDFMKNPDVTSHLPASLLLVCSVNDVSSDPMSLLENAVNVRAAGLILIGRTLNRLTVTDTFLSFCEEHTFPVIWVPGTLTVKTFVRQVFPYCVSGYVNYSWESDTLRSLCHNQESYFSKTFPPIYGYNKGYDYYCCILYSQKPEALRIASCEALFPELFSALEKRFCSSETPFLYYIEQGSLVCFLPFRPELPYSHIKEMCTQFFSETPLIKDSGWCAALGSAASSVEAFGTSYRHAIQTRNLMLKLRSDAPVSYYSDWHMHMLLLNRPEAELTDYMTQSLGPVAHIPDLLQTLMTYLEQGENLKQTAVKMHCHVNTLRYRLDKISSLLGCDLTDASTRLSLRIALLIMQYLNKL